MSTISGKTTSGQDEALIKAREDYKKKEAELIKKHRREISALNEKYMRSNEAKDTQNTKNLSYAREKTQEALTNRDAKYRQEIKDLKEMHQKQLERLMQENRERVRIQSQRAENEIKQANLGKTDRLNDLHNRYQEQHAEEVKKFSEQLEGIRQEQRAAVDGTRDKMNEAHERELSVLRDEKNATTSKLKNEYNSLRRSTDQRLRNQEVRHKQDQARASSAHMDNIEALSTAHNNVQEISREGYQGSLEEVRDKMLEARENDRDAQAQITGNFQAKVSDRINSQVNRLERDLVKTRDQSTMDQIKNDAQNKLEMDKMRDAYQDRFEYLEKARLDTLRQSQDINAQNIRDIRTQTDEQLNTSEKFHRQNAEINRLRNQSALKSAKDEYKLRQDYKDLQTQERIEKVIGETNQNEKNLRQTFADSQNLMRESTNNEKRDLRLTLEKEKIASNTVMKQQIQKQEVTHQKKMNDIVSNYEKRIQDLNDQIVREKRAREIREKDLVKNLNRQKQTEVDALRIQHEDQNRQAKIAHDREMREVTKRSQEKVDEILRAIKKS